MSSPSVTEKLGASEATQSQPQELNVTQASETHTTSITPSRPTPTTHPSLESADLEADSSSPYTSSESEETTNSTDDPEKRPPEYYYNLFSNARKWAIVFTCFQLSLTSTISSSALFPAVPEIADEFNTIGSVINFANAGYLLTAAVSPFLWIPLEKLLERRIALLTAIVIFAITSLITGLAPNLTVFIIFRCLSALQYAYFQMSGQSLIGEIFEPTKRGLAIGIFLAGTVLGPCIGPVIGGVIVTYRPWRVIFYLQAALVFFALIVAFFVIPTLRPRFRPSSTREALTIWDPRPLLRLFRFPNLCFIYLACGTQTFAQYTMITPVRYVMNPRFNLTSPLQSGLFFLAPGFGFVLGSCVGGKWADIVVKRYIRKRNGERIPEDRLKAGMLATLLGSPLGMLLYSWSIESEIGGMPLPIVAMFISGLAQMAGMSAMNTYCTEIKPGHSVAILAGKYLVQNCLSAAASAVILPFINAIGVGWAGTVATGIILVGAVAVVVTAYMGQRMRLAVEERGKK